VPSAPRRRPSVADYRPSVPYPPLHRMAAVAVYERRVRVVFCRTRASAIGRHPAISCRSPTQTNRPLQTGLRPLCFVTSATSVDSQRLQLRPHSHIAPAHGHRVRNARLAKGGWKVCGYRTKRQQLRCPRGKCVSWSALKSTRDWRQRIVRRTRRVGKPDGVSVGPRTMWGHSSKSSFAAPHIWTVIRKTPRKPSADVIERNVCRPPSDSCARVCCAQEPALTSCPTVI